MSLPLLAFSSLAAMTVLTVHRMRRARFSPVELSTARFFLDEPPSESQQQWVPCPPQWRDRSYLLQMAALFLLLLAAAVEDLTAPRADGLRVEICVDVSGSMDTLQDGRRRSEIAVERLRETLDSIERISAETGKPPAVRLLTFDLDVDPRGRETADLSKLRKLTVRDFAPKLVGTSLARLQRNLNRPPAADDDWSPTHVVVISDQPAPRWAVESRDRPVQWLDLARAVDSHGITRIEQVADALTGQLNNVRVHLQAWGTPPADTRLKVTGRGMQESVAVHWDDDGYARVNLKDLAVFQSRQASVLTFELSGTDAWPHDNRAAIALPDRLELAVRWQVPDVEPPDLAGWNLRDAEGGDADSTSSPAALVVTDFAGLGDVPDHVPVLLVGSSDGLRSPAQRGIAPTKNPAWFVCSVSDGESFLQDVNLDSLEQEPAMRPESVADLLHAFNRAGFQNANLRAEDVRVELMAFAADAETSTTDSRVALARVNSKDRHGRVVWMPLLPGLSGGARGRGSSVESPEVSDVRAAWQLVFLNAVSWLLDRGDAVLFERTSPRHPQPDFETAPFRLPLHPGEGDTSHAAKHQTAFDPSLRVTAGQPGRWWQLPLLLALIVMTVERGLAVSSGGRKT